MRVKCDLLEDRKLLGILVVCILLAAEAVYQARHGLTGQTEETYTEFMPALFGVRVKISDSMLVLFTAGLWWATRQLVLDARDASKRQQQAYLGVESATIEISDNANMIGRVLIKNYGQTPAYEFFAEIFLKLKFKNEILHPLEPIRQELFQLQHQNLPPGVVSVVTCPIELRVGSLDSITSDSASLHVRGHFAYRDIFAQQHIEDVEMWTDKSRIFGEAPFAFGLGQEAG